MLVFQEVEELESEVIILCYSKWECNLNYMYFSLPPLPVLWVGHRILCKYSTAVCHPQPLFSKSF